MPRRRQVTLVEATPRDHERQVATGPVWFGAADRPQLGWLTRPTTGGGRSGVVVAPPAGYEYWCGHRTLRVLAERLARAGHSVLRIDNDGTGDSAGDQWEPDRISSWRGTLAAGVAELRRRGLDRITLIGVRLGANFVLQDGPALEAERVVAWLPLASGRRYVKELKLMSLAVPADADVLDPLGTRTLAGSVFSARTLQDLNRLSPADISAPPAGATLVVDDADGAADPILERLRAVGADVTHVALSGGEDAFRTPPEFAVVPHEVVESIGEWLGAEPPGDSPLSDLSDHTGQRQAMGWRGGQVTETVLRLPGRGHVAVLTEPASDGLDPDPTVLVLLNTGSEAHVGPGRAWVELSRDLALGGRRSIRVDYRGWGESPDAGPDPGRPYDESCEADTVAILDELRQLGYQRLAVCGLCASAWIALAVAAEARPDAVIALNPQMYWKRGDPVEIDFDQIRRRRADEIRRFEQGRRYRLWSLLDMVGHRDRVGRWLDELAGLGIQVHLVFAENDDGLVHLRSRLSRRVRRHCAAGALQVTEIPGVDHPMHRTWMRPRVAETFRELLRQIDAAPAPGSAARSAR